MNRTFDKNKFDIVIKIVHLFLKWSVRALYVLIGLLVIGFVVIIFIPRSLLDFDIATLEDINVQLFNLIYEISDGNFAGIINVKWLIILSFFTGIMNIAFYQYIQIQLRNVIRDVKNATPFSKKNVMFLKRVAYAFLIASILLPLINNWLFATALNTFEIYNATIGFSMNFQSLFTGALVLILAYVFDYGSYLQEEHDMTV